MFKGFNELLNPTYFVSLTAGTIPNQNSISSMIMSLAKNNKLGGVTCETEIFLP